MDLKKNKLYVKIINRAEKEGFILKNERMGTLMDIESADKRFNLRLEEWLNADGFNFEHDFYGIQNNVVREKFPATDFGHFVPRFAGRKED